MTGTPVWRILWLLALMGCALDYGKEQTTPPDQVPQLVFENLHQTGVRDNQTLYTMDSSRAEVFLSTKEMRLKNFRFQEYDSQGRQASQGAAESAVIDSATNNAKISGKLTARSEERKVSLTIDGGPAGGLTWTNDDRILKTKPGTPVTFLKDDGSQVTAQALTLDLGSNHMQLEGNIQGSWVPEKNQDANAPTATPTPTPPAPPGIPVPAPSPVPGS